MEGVNFLGFTTFVDWDAVLRHVDREGSIFYHAPMDLQPVRVGASRKGKGRKVRITPGTAGGADAFWADEGHLERMRMRTV